MRLGRVLAAAVILTALAGCTAAPEVDPVVVQADELAGATVQVPLDSTIVVQTEHAELETLRADIADPAIVAFTEGADTGDVGFYPVFAPLAVGSTAVTVMGTAEPREFTIVVVPVPER